MQTAEYSWTGATLGPYTLGRLLGRGGTSRVYEAVKNDRRYAIKIPLELESIRPGETLDAALFQHKDTFMSEAEKWKELTDKAPDAVVNLVDFGEYPCPWMAMEYADSDFRHAIDDGSATVGDVVSLLRGLAKIHDAGVYHLDIKPQNIMRVGMKWKLTDFGYSRYSNAVSHSKSKIMGTYMYMAPEQLDRKIGKRDEKTDIWQMGLVAVEVITHRTPYGTGDVDPDVMTLVRGDVDLDGIPQKYLPVFEKVFNVDKSQRYESAKQFADDLEMAYAPDPESPREMYETGMRYYQGTDVTRRPEVGLMWIRRSAERGYPPAADFLSLLEDAEKERLRRNREHIKAEKEEKRQHNRAEKEKKRRQKKAVNAKRKEKAVDALKEHWPLLPIVAGVIAMAIALYFQQFGWAPEEFIKERSDLGKKIATLLFWAVLSVGPTALLTLLMLRNDDYDITINHLMIATLWIAGLVVNVGILIAALVDGTVGEFPIVFGNLVSLLCILTSIIIIWDV